jgi:hypothetical protein
LTTTVSDTPNRAAANNAPRATTSLFNFSASGASSAVVGSGASLLQAAPGTTNTGLPPELTPHSTGGGAYGAIVAPRASEK